MSGHVVRALVGMFITDTFRRDLCKVALKVPTRSRRGILLNQQGRGGMPTEDRSHTERHGLIR
jgi:hypothetical protein